MLGSLLGGVLGIGGSLLSGNQHSRSIKNAVHENLTPFTQQGIGANNFLADFLMGQGGADQQARFADTTGMNFMMDQGRNAIMGGQAAGGSLNSGATGKALTSFGQNLAQTNTMDFLNQINGVAGRGLGAGQAAVGGLTNAAGAKAQGQQNAIGGLTGLLGSIFG